MGGFINSPFSKILILVIYAGVATCLYNKRQALQICSYFFTSNTVLR